MDHLQLPPGKGHIKIRNFTVTPYTSGPEGFLGWPLRHGWSIEKVNSRDFSNFKPNQVRDFLQGWLFFGCVIEFLSICDISAQHSDFVTDDGQYVTTKRLPQMLEDWKKVARARPQHEPLIAATVVRATLILGTAKAFVSSYCLPTDGGQGLPANVRAKLVSQSPLPQRVWLSIIALGHALASALKDGCDTGGPIGAWGGSMTLEQRMLSKGWCPMDVQRSFFSFFMGFPEQYYLSKKQNTNTTISHADCTEFECHGRNIDETTYKQLHARGCDETCGGFQHADIERLTKMIMDGNIPVFKWDFGSQQLELTAVKIGAQGVGKPPFMAISHVWSDGLGNADENAVYQCQLEFLQKSVELAAANHKMLHGKPSHFWIDTLCIPVPKQFQHIPEKYEHFKKLRTKCIKGMRRIYESSCAVYVLSSLRDTATTEKGPGRRIAEVFNNWDTRLWTYQERIMARKRLIQYANKTVDHVDVEADFYRDMLWSSSAKSAADPLAPFAPHIASRSTSKKGDEMLCMASLMRLDLEPFLLAEQKIREERGLRESDRVSDVEVADKRMEIFWRTIGECHRGVLFNAHRRLTIDGLRWAPATFLSGPATGFVKGVGEGYCQLNKKGRGLSVSAQGFCIDIPPAWEATSGALGVEVKDAKLGRIRMEVTPRDLSFPGQPFQWLSDTRYVILLDKILSSHVSKQTRDPLGSFPQTRSQLNRWLMKASQPERVTKVAIDAVVASVVNSSLGRRCQIRHECLAVANIVDAPVLDNIEDTRYTVWDEHSKQKLVRLQSEFERMRLSDEIRESASRTDNNSNYGNRGDDDDNDNDYYDDNDDDDDSNGSKKAKMSSYYDQQTSMPDPDDEKDPELLQDYDNVSDSGSESADELCCGNSEKSKPRFAHPPQVEGTLTSKRALWYLL